MSSRVVATSTTSKTSQTNSSQRRQRSRSTSRYADLEKPKKKKALSTTTSLVSIPNTIKLSMLNSGLLSFEKIKLEARDQNNSLSQTIPDKPIELRHFIKLCEQRRKFPVLYKLEFQTAVKVETNSCRHASRKNNEEKNQNQKCIPYDYNRVVLEKQGRIADSDYINASYVDSLLKPNAYIVTQGPTEETVNDFWRMVWQENVSAIIMLTKTFDFTKVMCMQYWPPALDKKERYGDIHIGIDNEEQLANFHIRTFRIWKQTLDGKVSEERRIIQFHYTEWHSHTCPFSNAVLEFRRRVRSVVGHIIDANSVVGPMLVHCNDGGGRSGVYMAIDANLELAEEEDCFHVFGYLKKIRQSRRGLIENVDQYKFVYDTLEEHIVCGKTWFSVSELSERLKAKARKNPVTKMNHYQEEYAQICKQTPRFTIGDCAGGHRGDNRDKNRDVLCVPPDNFRPYLTSFQGNAFTDYINAVFVDGYTKPREYIVTEWPLKHTVGEFWSLVYDQECSAVVVLLQPPPNSTTYPSFWPEKSKMEKYGPVFSVHSVSRKHYTNIKQWEYKINKKIVSLTELMAGVKAPTKTVQLFQLTCFPLGHKVPTSTNSLVALMNMVENWRAKTDYGPVCVVSPDGRSRAGVYCAANACIEQVIQHGEVDIFQAVKTVRRQRPQLVENMMEYKYCYDLVLHYVLHYLNKDLKEKKFIEFGRGKVIPLSPDSTAVDFAHEKSTSRTGKSVVNKRICKRLEANGGINAMLTTQTTAFGGHFGGHHQHHHHPQLNQPAKQHPGNQKPPNTNQKKGRLYSLGGNDEPAKRPRGRLDRLRTVGTFDIGAEMSASVGEVARSLHTQFVCDQTTTAVVESADSRISGASNEHGSSVDSNRSATNNKLNSDLGNAMRTDSGQLIQQRQKSEGTSKIELDMDSFEDISKCYKDTIQHATSRKPILRKSKTIVRSDSETFDEPPVAPQHMKKPDWSPPLMQRNEILLQANYDIQIHQEPTYDRDDDKVPEEPAPINKIIRTKDSQDMSADSIDAVFSSDTNELQQLDREYRDIQRSSLQREYKSDGDTLDETGRRKPRLINWKNQSFENTFEMYTEEPIDSSANGSSESNPIQPAGPIKKPPTPDVISSKIIKPILKQTSSKESAVSSPLPSNRPNQLPVDKISMDSSGDRVKTTLSLFEKRFGKLGKINNLLKSKRFSTSALYDRKSPSSTSAATAQDSSLVFSPSDKVSNGVHNTTRSTSDESKSSLYSSKLSLFNHKVGRGFFAKRKPSLSQTELSERQPKIIARTHGTYDHSKSYSDIHDCKSAIGPKATPNSTGSKTTQPVLYQQPLQSPLCEEFYNPTGSVRLSAMELFEKFCSEDFGGLYKNETTVNLQRRGGTCGDHQNLHEYRLGQRGLGATGKYNLVNKPSNLHLLRQKSEPKFTFRDASTDEYFEEEDGDIFDDVEDDGDDEEDDQFDAEDEEEYDDEEFDDFEEHDERDEQAVDGMTSYFRDNSNIEDVNRFEHRTELEFIQSDSFEDMHDPTNFSQSNEFDSTVVDEIFLMPAQNKCVEDYDRCGYENKHFTLEHSRATHSKEPSAEQTIELRSFSIPSIRHVFQEPGEPNDDTDEVLTIYKLCPIDSSMNKNSASKQNLMNVIKDYVQTAPTDVVDIDSATGDPNAYLTDCGLLTSSRQSRAESLDQPSSSSCTLQSTIRTAPDRLGPKSGNLLDTCSTASRMSLSLKSEIFDDLILSPDTPSTFVNDSNGGCVAVLARSCEIDDFRLTPVEMAAESSAEQQQDLVVSDRDLNIIVEKFLRLEMSSVRQSNSSSAQNISLSAASYEGTEDELIGTTGNEDVSEFTTEITKEFDALFSRQLREEEEGCCRLAKENQATDCDPNDTPSKVDPIAFGVVASRDFDRQSDPDQSASHIRLRLPPPAAFYGSDSNASAAAIVQSTSMRLLPTRYSMQCLEPYLMEDDSVENCSPQALNDSCNVNGSRQISNRSADNSGGIRLQSSRSQSLDNLSNKTRCFPL